MNLPAGLALRLFGFNNVASDVTEVGVARAADLPGAAHLVLAEGVVHLDPASAVFEAMLEGWARQQRTRFLKDNTIGPRLELVRRFAAFTNQYPWQWEPAEAEAFITSSPVAVSTARNYQNT